MMKFFNVYYNYISPQLLYLYVHINITAMKHERDSHFLLSAYLLIQIYIIGKYKFIKQERILWIKIKSCLKKEKKGELSLLIWLIYFITLGKFFMRDTILRGTEGSWVCPGNSHSEWAWRDRTQVSDMKLLRPIDTKSQSAVPGVLCHVGG